MTRIAILALLPFLAGCDFLDVLEGKPSPHKAEMERRAAFAMPVVEVAVAEPAAVTLTAAVAPECFGDVFRVSRCVDGSIREW